MRPDSFSARADVVEVRVPKAGRRAPSPATFRISSNSPRRLSASTGNRWPGIYWTINPVNPALEARSQGKLKSFAEYDHLRRRHPLPALAAGRPRSETAIRHLQQRRGTRAGARVGRSHPFPSWRQRLAGSRLRRQRETVRTCSIAWICQNTPETTDLLSVACER